MKLLSPGVLLLAAFSSALTADEKAPAPAAYTGRVVAVAGVEDGHTRVDGETFRLVVEDKAGRRSEVPLDLQDRADLGFLLWALRHRELTVSGVLVEKDWPWVFTLQPLSDLTVGVRLTQPVLRVREVRVDFEKEPLDKPKGDD